ncbi:MAG: protease complex subunit PrcB family protein [Nitrospiraceae bacterium]|nr:protease complex subunit PrcB family protein [Nitrospiraceae bacterium]
MNRTWLLVIPLLIASGSYMPLHGEAAKPVVFRAMPDPEQWVFSDEPAYLVVTEKNWSRYYTSQPKGSDFANCIYIVASRGVKPNPGYRIRILQIQQQKDTITIKFELREPDLKKIYPQVIVRPCAVAEVVKADLQRYDLLRFVFTDQKGRQIATAKAEIYR